MKDQIVTLIAKNRSHIYRFKDEREKLRNIIQFCSEHNFEEEVRVAQLKLYHLEGVIYEYDQMIDNLEGIVNSNEE